MVSGLEVSTWREFGTRTELANGRVGHVLERRFAPHAREIVGARRCAPRLVDRAHPP